MRADVYTSILLDNRPFLSPAEVGLTLPRSNSVWHNLSRLSPAELVVAQQMEDDRVGHVLMCDVVSVALDPAESLPDLAPIGYELLMFGFQDSIWRFAHDPGLFRRLTGDDGVVQVNAEDCHGFPNSNDPLQGSMPEASSIKSAQRCNGRSATTDLPDYVGQLHRRMNTLTVAYRRLHAVLAEWKHQVTAALVSSHFTQSRDSLMSSFLLYHLSMMRLNAPLQDLYHVSYGASRVHDLDWAVVAAVRAWCGSDKAVTATSHALDIWNLVKQEIRRPESERARFNLLGFLTLHPSAALLWAVAQTHNLGKHNDRLVAVGALHWTSQQILQDQADLFDHLSPLGGSSFGQAALRLSVQDFPCRDEETSAIDLVV